MDGFVERQDFHSTQQPLYGCKNLKLRTIQALFHKKIVFIVHNNINDFKHDFRKYKTYIQKNLLFEVGDFSFLKISKSMKSNF